MARFSAKEDWKFINWSATLLTNLYRAVAAGVAWLILLLIFGAARGQVGTTLLMPVLFPLGYFCILLPIGLLSVLLNRAGIPYVGLVSVVISLCIVVGDPLLWIFDTLTKRKFVPAKDLGFFNFELVYFVIDEQKKAASHS